MGTLVAQYENMNYLLNRTYVYIGLLRLVIFFNRLASIFKPQNAAFFPEVLVLLQWFLSEKRFASQI